MVKTMEFPEILSLVIASAAPIATGIITYLTTRNSTKFSKTADVLEQQYIKVVAPIHFLLQTETKSNLKEKIYNIIEENYYLLPDNMLEEYEIFVSQLNFINENLNGIENLNFYKRIEQYNRILRFELRYSSTSTTKYDREVRKHLPISNVKRQRSVILTFALLLFIAYSIGEILVLLSIDTVLPNELKLVRVAVISSMSVILLLLYFFYFKIKRKFF